MQSDAAESQIPFIPRSVYTIATKSTYIHVSAIDIFRNHGIINLD